MSNSWKLSLFILSLTVVVVWLAVFSFSTKKFELIVCDVGQGDAVLAIYGNFEILTDGGLPNGRVLECLSRHMPFWDRTIEVVVNTHPQLDHYGGLIKVMQNYDVLYFVGSSLESGTREYQVLKKLAKNVVNPVSGQKISYGLMHYDVFWPTDEFLKSEGWDGEQGSLGTFESKRDPNDFSVQAVVSFGNFKALLTGDIGENMSDLVIQQLDSLIVKQSIQYIKIPHHGSKHGLTKNYIDLLEPEVAVISVGEKNQFGHPTKEILGMLNNAKIKTFRTDLEGDVVLESDGKDYWIVR